MAEAWNRYKKSSPPWPAGLRVVGLDSSLPPAPISVPRIDSGHLGWSLPWPLCTCSFLPIDIRGCAPTFPLFHPPFKTHLFSVAFNWFSIYVHCWGELSFLKNSTYKAFLCRPISIVKLFGNKYNLDQMKSHSASH